MKTFKNSILHGVIWAFVFLLNYLIISNYPVSFKPVFQLHIWLVYLLVFYINLLVLLPVFFFRKKFLRYIFLSIVLVAAANYTTVEIRKMHFSKMETERSQRMERTEPSESAEIKPESPPRNTGNIRQGPSRGRYYQRRSVIFSLTAIMLIYTLSFAFGMLKRYQENEKIRLQAEKDKVETELNSLKNQINPHFLFNSLNSIYSLANRQSEKTTEAVLKLSELLRYMIYETEKEFVPVQQEFAGLLSYIELQKLRLTAQTHLLVDIKMPDKECTIAPLLLLPVLENAFKYGSDNVSDSTISINAKVEDNTLYFSCTNTIITGLRNQNETSGIGLRNVRRRLELLYPGKYDFHIGEENNTFTVHLSLIPGV